MLHPDIPLYNFGGYVDLPGAIDPLLFAEATSLLVHKHDSLRMRLTSERDEDGVPLQTLLTPGRCGCRCGMSPARLIQKPLRWHSCSGALRSPSLWRDTHCFATT